MKRNFKKVLAFLLCLFLFCGVLPVSAEQTVTTVTRYTVPSYLGPVPTARVIAGDINGDIYVDNKDVTVLFKHLSGWDVEYIEGSLDVNGDSKVNNKDLTRLFQYLCDWDVQMFPVCEHTGGVATCCSKAVCELCNKKYGDYDSSNHSGGTEIRNAYPATCANSGYTGDTYCLGCNSKLGEGEYIPPTGIHANTEYRGGYPATCSESGYTGDVYCKDCGLILYGGTYIEPTGEHTPGEWSSDADIHWRNCTVCGIMLDQAQHSGGKATCHKKAICEICGAEYGGYDPDNHDGGTKIEGAVDGGYTGNVICLGCNQVISYGHYHSGGTATYYSKAVCATCGKKYGDYTQILAYDQLSDNQKGIYQILDTAVQNLDKSDISVFDYVDDKTTGESDINTAFRALSYDKPEYFWIPRTYGVGVKTNANTGKLLDMYVNFDKEGSANGQFHVSASQKASMQAALEAKVNEVVAGASAYDTVFEKEAYIHDYICDHVEYDYDAATTGNPDYRAFTTYGAFVLGTCVCEGYSRAMQLICQRVGIPCGLATGVYYTQDQTTGEEFATGHMWNIINPGDGCYYLDATFDDLDFDVFPYWHVYFNLSYEEMAGDHVFDSQYVAGADYSDVRTEYNFFDSHGNNYNLGYYTNTHAYILKNNATACADYIISAKAQGKSHVDIFFDENSMTAPNAIKLLNDTLAGRMSKITSYTYIDCYLYVTIP